ncbi:MAG TPA: hypothetical protein VJ301_10470 [Propionibacteriaceae bacterium]|nr:hypothetical protein [Propionibacteriaceae bacterium]
MRPVGDGDEGDPGSFCDRVLMEQDPHRVLAGLAYAAHAIGAERGYVYVRSEYPAAVRTMRNAGAEATTAGHLGRGVHGTATCLEVEGVEGAGSYWPRRLRCCMRWKVAAVRYGPGGVVPVEK